MNKDEFVEKARVVHGDKYDYSRVRYTKSCTRVCVICPEHGEFWQTPNDHLDGHGCPKCGGTAKLTTKEFVEKARVVHGDKYDYSKVNYINANTKVCIICPEHGEFWQKPSRHMVGGGCRMCYEKKRTMNKDVFIEKSKMVHGNKYDYSKVNYANSYTKICIICPEHGEFWQTPSDHLRGRGCKKCGTIRMSQMLSRTRESFIEKANAVHKGLYDYSLVNYKIGTEKVCIICPKHGEFWQTPNNHISGQGCPHCRKSKLEAEVEDILLENNIKYVHQYSPIWLNQQSIDFYLPEYNIAIECQGRQHYEPVDYFGGEAYLENLSRLDEQKRQLCSTNGLTLIYFSHYKGLITKPFKNLSFDTTSEMIEEIMRH